MRNLDELLDHSAGCDYLIHTAAQPAMTISTNKGRILKKMKMKNNAELTYYAVKNDMVE